MRCGWNVAGRLQAHQDGSTRHHSRPPPSLTKHDGKQEGKGHDGEHPRVDLPVARHTIRVHNGLEAGGEHGGLVVGGRRVGGHQRLQDGGHLEKEGVLLRVGGGEVRT